MLEETNGSESQYLPKGLVEAKFGLAGTAGFQPLPDVLLFHQHQLGLRSEDLNVLLNITAHWFFPERMPFPRTSTIARRMNVSERTVQRSIARLKKLGLIGKTTNADGTIAHDLRPLVDALQAFAHKRLALKSRQRTA